MEIPCEVPEGSGAETVLRFRRVSMQIPVRLRRVSVQVLVLGKAGKVPESSGAGTW